MRTAITKYRSGTEEERERIRPLYEAAFGKKSDPAVVDSTIAKLESGTLRAQVDTHSYADKATISSVKWNAKDKKSPWNVGPALFSSKFFDTARDGVSDPIMYQFDSSLELTIKIHLLFIVNTRLNDHGRIVSVIHEATHQLANTGDDLSADGKRIVAGDEETPLADPPQTGCM